MAYSENKYKSQRDLLNWIAYIVLNVAEIIEMYIAYKQAKIGCWQCDDSVNMELFGVFHFLKKYDQRLILNGGTASGLDTKKGLQAG